jgi:hypothetical protein
VIQESAPRLAFTLQIERAAYRGIAEGADLGSDEFAVHILGLSPGTSPLSTVASQAWITFRHTLTSVQNHFPSFVNGS